MTDKIPTDTLATLWLTYDPETGWEEHATEAEARSNLDGLLDYHRDAAGDVGWHEDVGRVRLVRAEVVASLVLTRIEDEEKQRDGFDWTASGDIVEAPAAESVADLRAALDAERAAHVETRELLTEARQLATILADEWDDLDDDAQRRVTRALGYDTRRTSRSHVQTMLAKIGGSDV